MSMFQGIQDRPPAPAPKASALARFSRACKKIARDSTTARGMVVFAALAMFALGYAIISQSLPDADSSPSATKVHVAAVAPESDSIARSHALVPAPKAAPAVAPASKAAVAPAPKAAVALAPKIAVAPAPLAYHAVDDGVASAAGTRFAYVGSWEHLTNIPDGRSNGTSSRTFHAGAKAMLAFSGERLQLFGVEGPNGGSGMLSIDGKPYGAVRFYAPRKEAGVLVYESPILPAGRHTAEIVVAQASGAFPKRRFVNLDGAAVGGR